MPSTEATYSIEEQNTLLDIADASIDHGLRTGNRLSPDISSYSEKLQQPRATFVTLKIQDELRGCIGTLRAVRPLVDDVAYNAYAAAFEDPRFLPLQHKERDTLKVSISILSVPENLPCSSEDDLLEKIQPGIDGIILSDGMRRATFLPSVWESLPAPGDFIRHLKQKAGFSPNYWSSSIQVQKYQSFSFSRKLLHC